METNYTFTREEAIYCFKKWCINVIENPEIYEASQIKDGDNYIDIGNKIHDDAVGMADAFIGYLTEKK